MDEKYWEEIRQEFPVTQHLAYFQSAGMSPMPKCALHATVSALERISQYGDKFFLKDMERADSLRVRLAEMIHTLPDDIAFAHNTSTGFSFIAAALKASAPAGFNLVSLLDEFPSTHIPFEYQGIPVRFVAPVNGSYAVESIMEATDENSLGVVCSQVQYATGFQMDMVALGKALKARGLLFIANATQAFPIFEANVQEMHIDVLSVSFHKWGLGGVVGSMLYTSEAFRAKFPNPMAGWLSVMPPADDFIPTQKNIAYQQYPHAGQYNFGSVNFQVLAGLDAAMEFVNNIGRAKIRERITYLIDLLLAELKELPLTIVSPLQNPAARSAIVLIDLHNRSNAEAVDFLSKHNVVTSLRMGKIRISCNFFNNRKDIDQLVQALRLFCEM